jgi:hypothetical protein
VVPVQAFTGEGHAAWRICRGCTVTLGGLRSVVLTPVEQARIGTLVMRGSSRDSSTFTQVAGDQYSIHLPPAPPLPAMCTLPVDTVAFTGRGKELPGIITAVSTAAEAGRMVAIQAIDGMAGVGKTALAVHVRASGGWPVP